MDLVSFALRRPVTVLVLVTALVLAGGLAAVRMEGFITNYYDYHFL